MYIDKAKQLGMKALSFSEHGNIFNWISKKQKVEAAGMKYVHAIECYITESLSEKIRDNYHCVLIAKNWDGVKEINNLVSISGNRDDGHFYFVPRISIDEFCNISDNIVVTSACLASILSRGNEKIKEKYLDYFVKNKDRCFFEIQHHNVDRQKEYNRYLYDLSQKTGVKLVAGTDTHSLDKKFAKGREILQKAKNIYFGDEDGWDLTFKSYDELVDSYKEQNSLPEKVYLEAIENTNLISDMVESFELDITPKYPELYENPVEEFDKVVLESIDKHEYALKNHSKEEILKRVNNELDVFHKTKTESFMLFQKYVRDWERDNGIFSGPGRGSSAGSMVAYLLNITSMDSMRFDLPFFRFMNPDRVSMADID